MSHPPGNHHAGSSWTALVARVGGLCAAPGVGGSASGGTTTEFLPIALVLAAFTATGVWMFQRWGRGEAASEVGERAPVADPRAPGGRPADARPAGA